MKNQYLSEFLEQIIGKQILIFGMARSGNSLLNCIMQKNNTINVYCFDEKLVGLKKKDFTDSQMNRISFNLDQEQFLQNYFDNCKNGLSNLKYLVISPGIDYINNQHFIIQFALNHNIRIVCDIELFWILCAHHHQAFFIGITGSNGKSTTTALVNHILQNACLKTFIGGNFGIPVFDLPLIEEMASNVDIEEKIYYVLEISSYQIDLMNQIKFDIGAIVNITSDHLERYDYKLDNYIKSKARLVQLSKKIILGINDGNCLEIFNQQQDNSCGALYGKIDEEFNKEQTFCFNITNSMISFAGINQGNDVISNPYLKGDHNLQNIIISYAISFLIIQNHSEIVQAINGFLGLEYRMQLIAKFKNIYFINDSKATSGQACGVALKCFENIYLILGGVPKSDGLEPIIPYLHKIKKCYLIGQSSEQFAEFLDIHNVKYMHCMILESAANQAFIDCKQELFKDNVEENEALFDLNILLSPACASFDQFDNFEHRGKHFTEIVFNILKKEQ